MLLYFHNCSSFTLLSYFFPFSVLPFNGVELFQCLCSTARVIVLSPTRACVFHYTCVLCVLFGFLSHFNAAASMVVF